MTRRGATYGHKGQGRSVTTCLLAAGIAVAALQGPAVAANTISPGIAATLFADATDLLPCPRQIESVAFAHDFLSAGSTLMDQDYIDQSYADATGDSVLTVAREITPLGPQYSTHLSLPETDRAYAKAIGAALRGLYLLEPAPPMRDLKSGAGYSWDVEIPAGDAKIILRHDRTTTEIFGLMAPLKPGTPVFC